MRYVVTDRMWGIDLCPDSFPFAAAQGSGHEGTFHCHSCEDLSLVGGRGVTQAVVCEHFQPNVRTPVSAPVSSKILFSVFHEETVVNIRTLLLIEVLPICGLKRNTHLIEEEK